MRYGWIETSYAIPTLNCPVLVIDPWGDVVIAHRVNEDKWYSDSHTDETCVPQPFKDVMKWQPLPHTIRMTRAAKETMDNLNTNLY